MPLKTIKKDTSNSLSLEWTLPVRNYKLNLDKEHCPCCTICKTVCPIDAALELKRTRITHSPVRSGAWNKALERLTSPTDMTKELKTKGSSKARESVMRRMRLEEKQHA